MKTVGFLATANVDPFDLGSVYACFAAFPNEFKLTIVSPSSDLKENFVQGYHFYGYGAIPIQMDDRFDIFVIPALDFNTYTKDIEEYIKSVDSRSTYTLTVCMGSSFLAMTGLLDGKEATVTKGGFSSGCARRPQVKWITDKRWVTTEKYWTSSGASAGIDMAASFLCHLLGENARVRLESELGMTSSKDPNDDPFRVGKPNLFIGGIMAFFETRFLMTVVRYLQSCHWSFLNVFFGAKSKSFGIRNTVGVLAYDGMDLSSFVLIDHLLALNMVEFKVSVFNPTSKIVTTGQGLELSVEKLDRNFDFVFIPDVATGKHFPKNLVDMVVVQEALYSPLSSDDTRVFMKRELSRGIKGNVSSLNEFHTKHVGNKSFNFMLDMLEIMPHNRPI